MPEHLRQIEGLMRGFGMGKQADAKLENYVTGKTLDGLYLMIAEEEKHIRADPAAAAGHLTVGLRPPPSLT